MSDTQEQWIAEAERLANNLAGAAFRHGIAYRSREDDAYNEAMDAEVESKDKARRQADAALLAHLRTRPAVTLSDEQQPPEVADILSLAAWHGAQACNLPAVSVLPKHQHRETAEVLRQYARALLARASVPTEAQTAQSAPDGGYERDAKRYRWLRERLAVEDVEQLDRDFWGTPDEAESKKTDAAIDAAMSAVPAGKE